VQSGILYRGQPFLILEDDVNILVFAHGPHFEVASTSLWDNMNAKSLSAAFNLCRAWLVRALLKLVWFKGMVVDP